MATAEYVFLCSLMGNDFVPASSLLRIADEGIENIIEIYHTIVTIDKYILSHKQDFITNTHTIDINFEFLEQIMLTLAIDERQNGIRLEEEMQKRFFRPN
jgi:5'-3' exonuclease